MEAALDTLFGVEPPSWVACFQFPILSTSELNSGDALVTCKPENTDAERIPRRNLSRDRKFLAAIIYQELVELSAFLIVTRDVKTHSVAVPKNRLVGTEVSCFYCLQTPPAHLTWN
jgi:hypothetical protein